MIRPVAGRVKPPEAPRERRTGRRRRASGRRPSRPRGVRRPRSGSSPRQDVVGGGRRLLGFARRPRRARSGPRRVRARLVGRGPRRARWSATRLGRSRTRRAGSDGGRRRPSTRRTGAASASSSGWRPVPRWAAASYRRIEPATAALSESIRPCIGILTSRSQRRRTAAPRPLPSLPTTIATGPRKSASRAVSGASPSAPTIRRPRAWRSASAPGRSSTGASRRCSTAPADALIAAGVSGAW